ncbi:MAG: hypothetical protein K5673_09540 [Lachnospiraceae bacterium]|nr:hypothetical protein [Lachnospiraceae bacterium]
MPDNGSGSDKSQKILIYILIGVAAVCLLAALVAVGLRVCTIRQDRLDTADVTEVPEGADEDDVDTDDAVTDDASITEPDQAEEEETEEEEEEEEEYTSLACAPAESMTLRSSYGFDDNDEEDDRSDVIRAIYPGTYLKWYGVSETVSDESGDKEESYYYVKVADTDEEGYVAAKYCVEVTCPYDESDLNTVSIDNALYTYDDMVEDLKKLASDYPDRLSYEVIGKSVDGRDIYAVTLGNPDAEGHVMGQATIHGREYMNTQLMMRLIEYYCYYYDDGTYSDVTYRDLFEKTAFHIVPMANPDGVTISQFGVDGLNDTSLIQGLMDSYDMDKPNLCYEQNSNGDYNWADHYKEPDFDLETSDNPTEITFEEYLTQWKANAHGVDLNNNFDAGWDGIELKTWRSYGSFKGDSAVSEPETQALVDYAGRYDYLCFMSYHSMGQLIYYDVNGNTAENSARSLELAETFEDHIKYKPVNTNKGYNVNLGGFGDWIQLSLNKPSVTIESGKKPCPLDISEFTAIWLRHRESWAMLAHKFY